MPYTLASTRQRGWIVRVGKAAGTPGDLMGSKAAFWEDTVHTPPSGQCLSPPQDLVCLRPTGRRAPGQKSGSVPGHSAYASAWQKQVTVPPFDFMVYKMRFFLIPVGMEVGFFSGGLWSPEFS